MELELPTPWGYMESVTHNNNIYLVGGTCQNQVGPPTQPRNVWRFSPEEMSLTKLSHMREYRNFVSLVELNDEIYALGGLSGRNTGLLEPGGSLQHQ